MYSGIDKDDVPLYKKEIEEKLPAVEKALQEQCEESMIGNSPLVVLRKNVTVVIDKNKVSVHIYIYIYIYIYSVCACV